MQDFESWKENVISNASVKGGATRRLITSFFKESCIRSGTPKVEIVKMLDKHSKWHGIEPLSDDDIVKIMEISISTVHRARSPQLEEESEKEKIRGRPRKLDVQAEPELVAWIKSESLKGHDPTRSEVTAKAQEIIDKEGKGVDLSRHWIDSFLGRNCSPVQQKVVKPIEEERFEVKEGVLEEWFDLLARMSATSIHPSLMLNLDEIGFGSSTMKQAQKKIVIRSIDADEEPYYKVERASNHISAICTIAANGEILKSAFIGSNLNLKEDATHCTFYGRVLYRSSKNAFITNDIYKDYIGNVVVPYIEEKRKKLSKESHRAMLIVDGHKAHFSDDILAVLADHNIEYVSIPPHSSHLLQPLDRHFFSQVKSFYRQKNPNTNLCAFTSNLENIYIAIEQASVQSTILSSFRRAGIVPELNEGEASTITIAKNRVISERTGIPYESPEDSDAAHSPKEHLKSKVKKTGNTRWGLWNAEQLLRIERKECPLCGNSCMKEYKQ